MKTRLISRKKFRHSFFFAVLLILFAAQGAYAASTGSASLLKQFGYYTYGSDGDYVTATMDRAYHYYIEVPPGLSQLRVQLYDADIGRGGAGETNDWQKGGSWNSSCRYTLFNPSGAQVATFLGTSSAGSDNAWMDLHNTTATPIANGHWRLVVDMTSSIDADGDDNNGYGIRADDGNEGSGGTELNIYAHSFIPMGRTGTGIGSTSFTIYPWVTSGCTVDWNDWDGDSRGTLGYSSRTGHTANAGYTLSANDSWQNRAITYEANDAHSVESGLWTASAVYANIDSTSPNNYGVFYVGNQSAYNPSGTSGPSAQPEANTFRIYLPTDGGGKPAKPYLTQRLQFVSGPNPLAVGSTSIVAVVIELSNPTAQPIGDGSAAVSAYVPGGAVLYDGPAYASVSQGAISSQPGAGGSGALVWNPGTVAAGDTATLYYQIRVRPTGAGLIVVTGSSSSVNGTRATYLDETRASTYTYGSLCGLAVTAGGDPIPTWAGITCFDACAEETQPTVEWHTSAEVGSVGYNLWRKNARSEEYEPVNPGLLPALPGSPQGGVYRFADPGAFSGEPVTYRLEEVDAQGRVMTYGPFTVTFGSWAGGQADAGARLDREETSEVDGYRRFARGQSLYERQRLERQRQELAAGQLQAVAGGGLARVTVKGKGIFYVQAAQVARALGIDEMTAQLMIAGYGLKLTGLGQEVPWLADGEGAGFYFYNPGVETVFCDRNVYFVQPGNGRRMLGLSGPAAGAADGQAFNDTLHLEENRYPLLISAMDPAGDIWFWDWVAAGAGGKTFAIDVPGPATGQARLAVSLQGATDTPAADDHHALVSVNGRQVGEALWGGTAAHQFEVQFDASLLQDGANTVTVAGVLDTGAPYSVFYVESFDLSYPRHYRAVNNRLACRGDNNRVITVAGLTETRALVLDVSRPERPLQVEAGAVDVLGRLAFVPAAAAKEYAISGLNAALRPLAVTAARPAKIPDESQAYEHAVIAPRALKKAAGELAAYRSQQGLKSVLVLLEDIYDEYNNGVADPHAVRTFLSRFAAKGLKYAVLAGKGTYDYNDYLGYGDNLLPALLGKTPEGLCASDRIFADLKGEDGVAEIAIGRLPATSESELQAMVGKIKAYEAGSGAWQGQALLIADNADGGGDFASGCNELGALATGLAAEKVYLDGTADEERAQIAAAWNAGAGLVSYCGHAGIDQLATENLLDVPAALGLANGDKLPLVTMYTCAAGRFELPGFASLAEALLANAGGGMAGGMLPSGAAYHADSLKLGEQWVKAVYQAQVARAGDAWLAAAKNYMLLGGKAALLNVYNWFGDPGMLLK